MGTELAGLIEAVGDDVTRFTVGDAVLAHTGTRFGAQAQYACVPADGLVAGMPAGASFAEAAALPNGGMEAFTLLRRAGVGPDQRVAIIGAGGSIGTMAVQLATHLGARVTAVDAADKLAMLRSIGAHRTIDFRQDDVTADGPWDVVFDVPGVSPFAATLASLTPTGTYVIANPRMASLMRGAIASRRGDRRVLFFATDAPPARLQELCDLVAAGHVRPVVDRCFPLAEAADAHRYAESGRKQGNIVLLVD